MLRPTAKGALKASALRYKAKKNLGVSTTSIKQYLPFLYLPRIHWSKSRESMDNEILGALYGEAKYLIATREILEGSLTLDSAER